MVKNITSVNETNEFIEMMDNYVEQKSQKILEDITTSVTKTLDKVKEDIITSINDKTKNFIFDTASGNIINSEKYGEISSVHFEDIAIVINHICDLCIKSNMECMVLTQKNYSQHQTESVHEINIKKYKLFKILCNNNFKYLIENLNDDEYIINIHCVIDHNKICAGTYSCGREPGTCRKLETSEIIIFYFTNKCNLYCLKYCDGIKKALIIDKNIALMNEQIDIAKINKKIIYDDYNQSHCFIKDRYRDDGNGHNITLAHDDSQFRSLYQKTKYYKPHDDIFQNIVKKNQVSRSDGKTIKSKKKLEHINEIISYYNSVIDVIEKQNENFQHICSNMVINMNKKIGTLSNINSSLAIELEKTEKLQQENEELKKELEKLNKFRQLVEFIKEE